MQGGPQDASSEPGGRAEEPGDAGAAVPPSVPWFERAADRPADPDATQAAAYPVEPERPADPDATQAAAYPVEPEPVPPPTEPRPAAGPPPPCPCRLRTPRPRPAPGARQVARRSRGARAGRLLSWVAFTLGVLLVVSSGTAFGLYRHYGGRIEQLPEAPSLQAGTEQQLPDVVGRDEVYLVVGSDSGDDLTDEQLRSIGANRSQRDGVRTDTIILVEVPADGSRASLVSFPRDSWVEIPGHGMNKINAAYELGEEDTPGGGPDLLIRTVEQLSGRDVDHFVQVSLYGFVTITNAVGGVEVCLASPAKDEDANVDLPAGRQVLDGTPRWASCGSARASRAATSAGSSASSTSSAR